MRGGDGNIAEGVGAGGKTPGGSQVQGLETSGSRRGVRWQEAASTSQEVQGLEAAGSSLELQEAETAGSRQEAQWLQAADTM